jgi:hypothetical protein
MFVGSSTTQTNFWLRVGLAQYSQGSMSVDVGDVIADGAEVEIGFDVAHGGGKSFGIVLARAEDMEGKPLRALAADSRQLLEFVDKPGHRLGKFRHRGFCNFVIG